MALAPPPCSAFVLLFFCAFYAMPACRDAKPLIFLHIVTDCSSVSLEKGCLIKGLCAYVQKCITGCTTPAKTHIHSTTSRTNSNHKESPTFPSNSSHVCICACVCVLEQNGNTIFLWEQIRNTIKKCCYYATEVRTNQEHLGMFSSKSLILLRKTKFLQSSKIGGLMNTSKATRRTAQG